MISTITSNIIILNTTPSAVGTAEDGPEGELRVGTGVEFKPEVEVEPGVEVELEFELVVETVVVAVVPIEREKA